MRYINMYTRDERTAMSTDQPEFVIASWGTDAVETEILTVELPAREMVVQLEIPVELRIRMTRLAKRHEMPVEDVIAERLEINRARIAVLTAKAADDVADVREQLSTAREMVAAVDTLDTSSVEDDIERLWDQELDSRS